MSPPSNDGEIAKPARPARPHVDRVSGQAVAAMAMLAVVLAGCSDAGGPAAGGADATGFEQFEIPDDVLALRGVVVNEAIVPQQDVVVTLDDGPNTTTTASGTFVFVDVAPGVHVVRATKAGLLETTTTVSVAGLDDPIVRLVMAADAETRPYHQVLRVEMFLQCGVGAAGASYSTCQTPNGAVDIACDATGVCLGHPLDHNGLVEVDPGLAAPDFAQAEAVWEASSPGAERLVWNMWARERGTLNFDNGTGYQGPTPVIMPWNKTLLIDGQIGPGKQFVFQVYPWSDDASYVLQQRIDLFVTTFYNYLPPEGWTLSADGEPEAPR